MSPDEKRERLRWFEAQCRMRGLALTVQRRRILELILDRTDHPTADQVYEDAGKQLPGVSRTTVYRVLETLVDIGAITRACSPGATARFDPVTNRHHHLVCMHCQTLIDIDGDRFNHRVQMPDVTALSFEIRDFCIQFSGICGACRKKLGGHDGALRIIAKRARPDTTGGRSARLRGSRRREK